MKHTLGLFALVLSAQFALAQITAFTDQGRLDENGLPVTGICDLRFTIHDAAGVALAAIQGLNQKLEAELGARDSEIDDLRKAVNELKEIVHSRTRGIAKPQE